MYLLENTLCNTLISRFTIHYIPYTYIYNFYTDKAYILGGPACNARLSSSWCCRVCAPRHPWYTADGASDDAKNSSYIIIYINGKTISLENTNIASSCSTKYR